MGHYYAFLEGIKLLQHGELRGYILNWFGGMPLFYFYPPLAFWLMSALAIIFKSLSPILIFKGFLLLSLASLPVAFHFFLRSFFPKRKIYFLTTLSFSLAYLFYQPYEYGSIGIGLSSITSAGLIMEALAISLTLIFLAYLKQLLTENKKNIFNHNFWMSLMFGTLIVYTHILFMIFAAFFGGLILIFYFNKKNLKKVLFLISGLILSGAYVLYPLFAYLNFTSGWQVNTNAYFADPLLPLLGFDVNNLSLANFINFNWVWFFIFIFFLIGLIRLIKKQNWLLPMLFLISFILIPRNYLNSIFPTLAIHYYRMMPLIFFIYLAISVFGWQEFSTYFSKRGEKISVYITNGILIAILISQIYSFNFLNNPKNIKPRLIKSYIAPIQYYNNFNDYAQSGSAQKIVKYFKNKKITTRVAASIDRRGSMIHLGSAQYFSDFLPLNKVPVALGLYAESAYQLPFLSPPLAILNKDPQIYGRVFALMSDKSYMSQSASQAIKDLSLFNIKHLITVGGTSKNIITKAGPEVKEINFKNNTSQLAVYKIKVPARGYISSPKYLPALYIDEAHNLTFRNFSLGWYKMFDNLDFPVIFDGQNIENINKNNLVNISFIIVRTDYLSAKQISNLQSLKKQVVILSENTYQGKQLPKNFNLIENFRPNVSYYKTGVFLKPDYKTLAKLNTIFNQAKLNSINKKAKGQNKLKATVWQNEKISFKGQGPIIINASYFPDWRSIKAGQEVYQVSPGQMLVFSSGTTTLKFSSSKAEKTSGWISLVSIIIIIGGGILSTLTKNSKNDIMKTIK